MGADVPGKRIAWKYALVERAGEGGMAVVWRAMTLGSEGFERPVALKRALPSLSADPHFVAMFVEEARVNATLDHPNIVHIHDFGTDESGDHFLVMEWVDGLDLRRLSQAYQMQREQVPWEIAAAIMADVCRGLYVAHTRETEDGRPAPIIHRDVTPQNVLVSTKGVVKITDFGLARAMDRARMTSPGMLKGKLAYLAPELALDQPPSPQSDIFGVGIVLWEILAGERLFDGKSDVDVIQKVARATVPPIMAIRPEIPPALAEIVHTALAREPERRFPDARAMASALARVLRLLDDPVEHDAIAACVIRARQTLGIASARRSMEIAELERLRQVDAVRTALFGNAEPPSDPDLEAHLVSEPESGEVSGAIPLPLSKRKS